MHTYHFLQALAEGSQPQTSDFSLQQLVRHYLSHSHALQQDRDASGSRGAWLSQIVTFPLELLGLECHLLV